MALHDGELEERLRRHYQSSFGPSPDSAQIWEQVAQRLEQQAAKGMIELDEREGRRVLGAKQSADVQIEPVERAEGPAKRSGGLWRTFAALAATLLVIAMGGAVFGLLASRGSSGGPTETASTTLPSHLASVTAVQMLSDKDGWAIAVKGIYSSQDHTGVVLHFDGYRWKVVESFAHTELNSLSMVSATEGWIAGDTTHTDQNGQTSDTAFLLHYTGGHWIQESAPLGLVSPTIKMVNANFGWVIGFLGSVLQSIPAGTSESFQRIGVYHDGVWTMTDLPTSLAVSGVWFTSPTEGWAAGGIDAAPPNYSFWHYTGGHWSKTRFVIPANDFIINIAMTSSTNGWASGRSSTGGPLLFHYDGVAWIQTHLPANLHLGDLAALTVVSSIEFWAVGSASSSGAKGTPTPVSGPQDFLLHYRNGAWSEVNEPEAIYSELSDPSVVSSNDVWVGGNLSTSGRDNIVAAIGHYANGVWAIYK